MRHNAPAPREAYLAAESLAAGELAKAIGLAQRAIAKSPCPDAFAILAAAHQAAGAMRQADAIYRKGRARFPADAGLAVHYAKFLRQIPGRAPEAVALLSEVARRRPDYAPARFSLIETLRTVLARLDQAEDEARAYVKDFPSDADGHLALALVLFNHGVLVEALAAADRCLRLGGNAARAWELKANIHVSLGSARDALACYRALAALAPDPQIHSRMLMAMQYCDDVSEETIAAETAAWVRKYTSAVPRTPWTTVLERNKPLTVGILSRDFRQCSTLYLARPLLEHLPAEWTVVFYANVEQTDATTQTFRSLCDRWCDIGAMDDAQAAERIAADGIDVLIDLNGHGLGGRPGVLARKPAPVQVSWLDYVGSTGLATMDAIIADAGHVPMGDQIWYSEPIRHVSDNLYRYAPPADAPPVAPLPAVRNGFITFGCFNSAYKLSGSIIVVWAEILRGLPAARLLLNAPEYRHGDTRARFTKQFADAGVDAARLELRGGAPDPSGMLKAYGDVDIALDPAPYSGGLTTLEALYMGVPVVTAPGRRFGSRHSSVHLKCAGLSDWVASDHRAYATLALEKARDTAALATLRETLRGRLARSPFMDGAALAKDFVAILTQCWAEKCKRGPSPSA